MSGCAHHVENVISETKKGRLMAECYISNADQTRCRCGKFARVISETDVIVRVDCEFCGTQTLYGDELE